MKDKIKEVAQIILNAKRVTAFTGAGISVESGIPPFRGPTGLWSKYDPIVLDLNYFYTNNNDSWKVIKELFYDFFGKAKPNDAHKVLARMEEKNLLQTIITQNIDNLHQQAGSKNILEFHGTAETMICIECQKIHPSKDVSLETLPPRCSECDGMLKPNFIFFGEGIPEPAQSLSFAEATESDVFLVIGTTGEIMPASLIPRQAKERGAKIIEINPSPSQYTPIADVFLQNKASIVMNDLAVELQI